MHIARLCTALLITLLATPALHAQQPKEADDLWFKVSRKLVELTQRIEVLERKVAAQPTGGSEEQVAQLAAEVDSLQASVAGLSVAIAAAPVTVDALNTQKQGEVTASCPAGTTLTGLVVVDNDSGRNCKTCISGVRLLCSELTLSAAATEPAAGTQ